MILTSEIGTITQLITTVGFPIAMCCVMCWFVYDSNNKHRTDINSLNEQHNQELNNLEEAINNNTIAITKLCERIESENEQKNR